MNRVTVTDRQSRRHLYLADYPYLLAGTDYDVSIWRFAVYSNFSVRGSQRTWSAASPQGLNVSWRRAWPRNAIWPSFRRWVFSGVSILRDGCNPGVTILPDILASCCYWEILFTKQTRETLDNIQYNQNNSYDTDKNARFEFSYSLGPQYTRLLFCNADSY